MNAPGTSRLSAYRRALISPAVWRRAVPISFVVGLIQIAINQGDHWLNHRVTTAVVVKTILCPLVTLGVALISAAATHVELQRSRSS